MASSCPTFRLSEIDEERFGVRTARATQVTGDHLPGILEFCQNKNVKFLIARCSVSELGVVQSMEKAGFFLMDTLLYYARDLVKMPIPVDRGDYFVRPIQAGENVQVSAIASVSFKDYLGHYHADPRLERSLCDEAYASWAVSSCDSREVADEVLVAVDGETILGFATLRFNSKQEGEGVLFGVAPQVQGRGIYRSLMVRAMEWFLAKGRTRMVVSTQITNVAVQRVWTRLGFELSHACYTFHKWFD